MIDSQALEHAKPPRNVTESEAGGNVNRPPEEVDMCLKVLILNGGDCKNTAIQLKEEGIKVDRGALAKWRDRMFPRRYAQLRRELGRDVSEEIAGRALERALELDKAEQAYIEEAQKRLGEVEPNHLARSAYALANAKGQNVDRAQLLRNQPTSIVRVDLDDAVKTLERLKVVESIDGEAEDEEIVEAEVLEA
jgi:hypothetical protein